LLLSQQELLLGIAAVVTTDNTQLLSSRVKPSSSPFLVDKGSC
jgi:hypothetical protein